MWNILATSNVEKEFNTTMKNISKKKINEDQQEKIIQQTTNAIKTVTD